MVRAPKHRDSGRRETARLQARPREERDSPADEEGALSRHDRGTDLIEVAIAQKTSGRPVIELRVQPLEPRLRDRRRVGIRDWERDTQRKAQPLLDLVARRAIAVDPLVDGAGLAYASEIRHELRAEEFSQLGRDPRKGRAHRVSVSFEIRARVVDKGHVR